MGDEEIRGKIRFIGLRLGESETTKVERKYIILLMLIHLFFIITLFYRIMAYQNTFSINATIIFFIFFIIYLPLYINKLTGGEIDAIYENGITNRWTSYLDRLLDKHFVKWESIIEIRTGNLKNELGVTQYIQYISTNQSYVIPSIPENAYHNDYYNHVLSTLKKECPNAEWKQIDRV